MHYNNKRCIFVLKIHTANLLTEPLDAKLHTFL